MLGQDLLPVGGRCCSGWGIVNIFCSCRWCVPIIVVYGVDSIRTTVEQVHYIFLTRFLNFLAVFFLHDVAAVLFIIRHHKNYRFGFCLPAVIFVFAPTFEWKYGVAHNSRNLTPRGRHSTPFRLAVCDSQLL